MADLLTLIFQLALAGTALAVLLGMAMESWNAREPSIGTRARRVATPTTGYGRSPASARAAPQRRLGY
jgi:hypothetical protein